MNAVRRIGLAVAAALTLAGSAAATETPSVEELAVLKARLAAQQALLETQMQQLREQQAKLDELERRLNASGATAAAAAPPSAPKVSSRYDNVGVIVGGSLRTTLTTTGARMLPDATPFVVLPSVPGVREGTSKIDARLSTLLVAIRGREFAGFQLGGVIQAQLFDGDLLSGQYGVYPGVAYVEAVNDRWRVAAGLQPDVFSPRMPRMVDSMSAMAGSGNPGNSMKPSSLRMRVG